MKHYLSSIKKPVYVSSVILAGIILFIALSAFGINKSVLTPEFHQQLFVKNDIYTRTYNVIKNSMDGFIEDFKKHSAKDYEQHKDIFSLIEKSVTQEMVSSNLDKIREDAFLYFSGERMFLPDIYLGNLANVQPESSIKKDGDNKFSVETISKIEKVNLSAILLYINRNDITDQFVLIKLIYYILNALPGASMLLLLLLLLMGYLSGDGISGTLKWINRVFLTTGAIAFISGLCLVLYNWLYLPANIRFVALSLPIETEVVISYIRDCVLSFAFYLLACSIIAIIFSFLISQIGKRFPWLSLPAIFKHKASGPKAIKLIALARYSAVFIVFAFVLLVLSFKVYAFKTGYDANDFPAFVEKYKGSNKVTQVISAKDDTIYALQIKLIEPESGTPIANTTINISGKSNLLKKQFNETATTDGMGMAKFILDEGTFRFSFIQSDFPADYQLPSPFFFDLKAAGTTIITVHIHKKPEMDKDKWGVAEIEVLDKDNNPVQNLQLTIEDKVSAPGDPDSVFSVTNSEGIAVFKLNEGKYTAIFTEALFPENFLEPSPLNIEITPKSISRYTIRLAEPDPSKPGPQTDAVPDTKKNGNR